MRIAKTNLLVAVVGDFFCFLLSFPGLYFSFALKLLAHGRITVSPQNLQKKTKALRFSSTT